MGAAPTCTHNHRCARQWAAIGVIVASTLAAGSATARVADVHRSWRPIWAVQVAWPQQVHPSTLRFLHQSGINTLIVARSRWTTTAHRKLVLSAFHNGLALI